METKSRSSVQLQGEEITSDENEDSPDEIIFSVPQINVLLEQNVEGVQTILEEVLKFKQPLYNLYEAVLLDYYVSGFWWAKDVKFAAPQLCGFMTLLHSLMVNLETKKMSLEDNIIELARAMVGVGQSGAEKEYMLHVLTIDQAKDVITYLKSSLFQHYKLYECMMSSSRDELVIGTEQAIEVVQAADTPFPAPLEEGIPHEIYSTFIAPEPPSPVESPEGEETIRESQYGVESQKAADEIDLLSGFTLEDVKSALGKVTKEVIGDLETEINEKLRMQEEAYSVRIDKLKRT
ncbi:hypothetical protein NDU88_010855 [Pleurodeles waltl]|uniref:Ciliary-associated calcium-binding coiled-coil protein 1 n=1 Tax=Pleurodeles waltl TaxID=8319 RepID=A0AAV7QYQ0_PLEWA|nr:hypothetical protein NDU88_010855 [Pleurodeles waltl]